MSANLKRTEGSTLIEVLISVTLLGIIFLGTVQYFTLSNWQIERSTRSQLAWTSLASRLEYAYSLDYDALADSLPESSTSLTVNGKPGYRTTVVTPIDDEFDGVAPADTTVPDYYNVNVKFAWFEPDNLTDSIEVVFSEYGS